MITDDMYKFYLSELDAEFLLNSNEYCSMEDVFLKTRCEFLIDQEVIKDVHYVRYFSSDGSCRVDAWGTKPFDESLVLIISDFREHKEVITQNLSTFRTYLNKAKRFFSNSMKEDFRLNELKYGTSAAGFADYIYSRRKEIEDITIIGLTNTRITSRDNSLVITENTSNDYVFHYDVWDIERLLKIDSSSKGRESVDIDFVNDYGLEDGVEALKASVDCLDISSYLFVLSGDVLAKMYET